MAALGIAAHETGYAIQHAKAYAPLKARMAIVPITQIASRMLPFIILGGFFFHLTGLITLGIYCYLILLAFQLITLPVEFDASRRAKIILQQMGIVQPGKEVAGVNRVLNAAALTYVAAFIATLGNLLWLFSVRDRRLYAAPENDDPCHRFAVSAPVFRFVIVGPPARAKRSRDAMDQPRTDEDQAAGRARPSGRRRRPSTSWS